MELEEIKQNNKLSARDKVIALEDMLIKKEGTTLGDNQERCPLDHMFAYKTYGRKMFIPKGTPLTGKIHKDSCINVILSGDITVFTEEGEKRIKGPYVFVSPPGVKRIGFAHEDTIWMNIHYNPDNGTDLSKIEERVIAKNFNEFDEYQTNLLQSEAKKHLNQSKNNKENCGLLALKNFIDIENISIASIINIAKDNGLKLYAYKVKPNEFDSIPFPAILHMEDHFVFVSSKSEFDNTLSYTGNIIIAEKWNYEPIKKADQKKITGASWAAAIGASVAITGQILGTKAKIEAAKSECEKACDAECKSQTKAWEFKKRKECKAVCKTGCVEAIVDPAENKPEPTTGGGINPVYVIIAIVVIAIIVYLIYRKMKNK